MAQSGAQGVAKTSRRKTGELWQSALCIYISNPSDDQSVHAVIFVLPHKSFSALLQAESESQWDPQHENMFLLKQWQWHKGRVPHSTWLSSRSNQEQKHSLTAAHTHLSQKKVIAIMTSRVCNYIWTPFILRFQQDD